MIFDMPRRLAAELLGTGMLVATVVGSGIMAERLTDDVALALLGNTLPTGAILVVLITILGPISGAHFNPAVTLVFALRRDLAAAAAIAYVAAQVAGGILGTLLAHAMFELPVLQISTTLRTGAGQWIAEIVATFGLVMSILLGLQLPCRCHSLAGRALHHRGLLVHRLDLFRQSGGRHRARALRYLRRHQPDGPAGLPCRRTVRRCAGRRAGRLAARRNQGTGKNEGCRMTVTIYHNPQCGTSRNTLAMIRQSGEEPEVIEYLKTPPSRARLVELIAAMGMKPRDLLREKGTPYAELGLDDPKWSDDELIDFMMAYPILINRPIVVTPLGTVLARPSEAVLKVLPNPDIGGFVKEDGEVVKGGGKQG